MRRAAIVFAAWAGLLAVSTTVLALMDGSALPIGLLGGAAAASLLTGAGLFVAGGRVRDVDPDLVRPLPETSYATAVLAIGACLVVFGLAFEVFMVLIGAAVMVFGVAGLLRERIALRRARKQVVVAGPPANVEETA